MKLKDLNYGQEMPRDFWNYKVNPIVGYYVEPQKRNTIKETNKYAIKSIPESYDSTSKKLPR